MALLGARLDSASETNSSFGPLRCASLQLILEALRLNMKMTSWTTPWVHVATKPKAQKNLNNPKP